jgi:hypothetical protein
MFPVTIGALHVYLVPTGTLVCGVGFPVVGVKLNAEPLQATNVLAGIKGTAPTTMLTENVGTTQPLDAVGVTV